MLVHYLLTENTWYNWRELNGSCAFFSIVVEGVAEYTEYWSVNLKSESRPTAESTEKLSWRNAMSATCHCFVFRRADMIKCAEWRTAALQNVELQQLKFLQSEVKPGEPRRQSLLIESSWGLTQRLDYMTKGQQKERNKQLISRQREPPPTPFKWLRERAAEPEPVHITQRSEKTSGAATRTLLHSCSMITTLLKQISLKIIYINK